MSVDHCPHCGKDQFLGARDFHRDFDHHHIDRHKFDRDVCICESFVCDDHFKVRLGGLTGGLNFRLRQLTGCEVKMKVTCGETCKTILAKICFVGSDFVEVNVLTGDREDIWDDLDDEEEKELKHDILKRRRKKRQLQRHHKRRDHHDIKDTFIFPFESIKWFELKDDCDCDCDDCHGDCDCHT
ncbi:hypothetical protein J416_07007 [Gracilibacillus halophilus YIM-C55.5]|uniref:Uncharacterized protein n=1 Tax=Gracilibacillus halophilus YIM-C55.5 TaxID=1308866 RepID=N4WA54_9BACI|nr:hypothetical protein [Gracilibacillus halophilus]ENH97173.1 hypothetical protein J416_07007 [Gracilibacillus halophilus YIM-C55.5]